MSCDQGGQLHPLLVDQDFWRDLLDAMAEIPQRLLVYPRPDLSEPGVEVVEFSFRAHDDERLWGLCARSAFRRSDQPVRLRLSEDLDPASLDWEAVRDGEADLLLQVPRDRRLRDRVLDILRLTRAARELQGIDAGHIQLDVPRGTPVPDAVLIAEHLMRECQEG